MQKNQATWFKVDMTNLISEDDISFASDGHLFVWNGNPAATWAWAVLKDKQSSP